LKSNRFPAHLIYTFISKAVSSTLNKIWCSSRIRKFNNARTFSVINHTKRSIYPPPTTLFTEIQVALISHFKPVYIS
jgi:hypothetical protein